MGEALLLAVGIAASPFPVVPAILLLFTARPRPTALAFLVAWFAGIGVVAGAFTLLSDVVSEPGDSPTWLSWVRIVLGAGLLVVGVRRWLARGVATEPPGWVRSIEQAGPGSAARLALLLSVANPKVVLLAAAAGLDIGASELTAAGELAAVLAFTVVAALSVAVPVLAYVVVGERVLRPLATAKDWLLRNSAATMAVVIVVIGVVLLKNGIGGL